MKAAELFDLTGQVAGEGVKMTREIPAGRFGEERDLDGALLLFASDAGRYITGATVVVDGGRSCTCAARERRSLQPGLVRRLNPASCNRGETDSRITLRA